MRNKTIVRPFFAYRLKAGKNVLPISWRDLEDSPIGTAG